MALGAEFDLGRPLLFAFGVLPVDSSDLDEVNGVKYDAKGGANGADSEDKDGGIAISSSL